MMKSCFKYMLLPLCLAVPALAESTPQPQAYDALLELCADTGETASECQCYLGEVTRIFPKQDVDMANTVSRAFLQGQEPDVVIGYLILTRQLSVQRANLLYQLGEAEAKNIGKTCDKPAVAVTPEVAARRKVLMARLEALGRRYGLGK